MPRGSQVPPLPIKQWHQEQLERCVIFQSNVSGRQSSLEQKDPSAVCRALQGLERVQHHLHPEHFWPVAQYHSIVLSARGRRATSQQVPLPQIPSPQDSRTSLLDRAQANTLVLPTTPLHRVPVLYQSIQEEMRLCRMLSWHHPPQHSHVQKQMTVGHQHIRQ